VPERRIRIAAGQATVHARLNDSSTADLVWDKLPIQASANTWGDEIYFEIPVAAAAAEDADPVVPMGAVAYWPPGRAMCLFFGPTPVSRGREIRAASAVNLIGSIEGDPAVLRTVRGGSPITIERA